LILAAADLSVGIDRQQRTSGCVKKEILWIRFHLKFIRIRIFNV
jgi:hypothetical protein